MSPITIIIATYNAGKYLQKCLDSIIPQKNELAELIIIDGGSKDNTIEIIRNNQQYLSYWISEPDHGIYDAWNKGIIKAKGEWIMFLGADDLLLPESLDALVKYIKQNSRDLDIISSKLDYVTENGSHIRYIGEPWNWEKFKMSKMSFAHPGMLHSSKLFARNGLFDTTFKICGDSEFFLRTQGNMTAGFVDFVTVKMQRGGMSYSAKAIVETYHIRQKNHTLPAAKNSFRFLRMLVIFYLSKIKHAL